MDLHEPAADDDEIAFDETYYLATNPDIAAAVAKGGFPSGLSHYRAHGRLEGRLPVPPTLSAEATRDQTSTPMTERVPHAKRPGANWGVPRG